MSFREPVGESCLLRARPNEPAAVEREAPKNSQASALPPLPLLPPLPPQADGGWTSAQLALVLMFNGVFAVLLLIKCLVFGPPPYSPLAYVVGPCLIVVGYLADPHPIRSLRNDRLKPPEPPPAEGGQPGSGGRGTREGEVA
jgi:hypothetical protein